MRGAHHLSKNHFDQKAHLRLIEVRGSWPGQPLNFSKCVFPVQCFLKAVCSLTLLTDWRLGTSCLPCKAQVLPTVVHWCCVGGDLLLGGVLVVGAAIRKCGGGGVRGGFGVRGV